MSDTLDALRDKVRVAQNDINAIVRKLADDLPIGYEIKADCPERQYYQQGGVEIPRIFIEVVVPG